MSKNVENAKNVEEVDETRVAIEAKIEAKRKATGLLETKAGNLDGQIMVYENAIVNYEEKMRKAKERLESFKTSKLEAVVELSNRQEEIDHMEEILARYDKAQVEKAKAVAKVLDRIANVPDTVSEEGIPKSGFMTDAVYLKAVARRDYLDSVLVHALSDVRKIFVSRGVISDYNVKGSKAV